MIEQHGEKLLFHYRFQPLMSEFRVWPGDGGFSVTVYGSGEAMITTFDIHGKEAEQLIYQVQNSVIAALTKLADESVRWSSGLPSCIETPEEFETRFINWFGIEGSPLVEVHDAGAVSQLPFGEPDGCAARHLVCLLEDASEILQACGLHIGITSWGADEKVARLKQTNEGHRGRRGSRQEWRGAAGF